METARFGTAPAMRNVVVVIPTFNERDNIASLVGILFGLYPEIHVLVVDDHSPDGTADAVRELQHCYGNLMLLERMHHPGFAASYRDGFRQVLAEPWCEAVISMDADFSHNPEEIRHLVAKLAGREVVVGSRYAPGGSVKRWNLRRRLLSRAANFYVNAVLGVPVRDVTAGFLCMRREALERVSLQRTASEGYAFLVELKYLLSRAARSPMAEHPIVFDERREGQSKMSAGKVWESFWLPWRIRLDSRATLTEKPATDAATERDRRIAPETTQASVSTPLPLVTAQSRIVDRRNILLCIALVLLALAATKPVYEMGFEDDWSYSHIAREFASSGHVVYDGHTAVMLLPQIVWSALFIKFFGFSFLVMRLSTVVLGVALIPVLYYLGRESGLEPPFALFATLLTALSPLVLPVTASFMSDVPAFLLFVLCFYGAVRSWKADGTKTCLMSGALTALAGTVGGLDRQIYWLAPLLFLPVVAWVQRRRQGALAGLGVAWLSTIAVVAFFALWFQRKPYTLDEHILDQWRHDEVRYLAPHSISLLIDLVLTAGLLLLPVLIAYASPGFRAVSRVRAVFVLACVLALEYALRSVHHDHRIPRMGNILTEYGVQPTWPGLVAVGMPPLILVSGIRHLLTAAVLLCCAYCGLALWKRRAGALWHGPAAPALVLGLVFAAAWFPAMLVRSVDSFAYDRYLIAFLPLAAVPLLWFCQAQISPRVSRWSWAAMALYAFYGVATTHDAFAAARARSLAARSLEEAGISRTEIDGGFEYNGWTQLEAVGYVNAPAMEKPEGAYRPVICTGPQDVLWYTQMMPAVRARYFVVVARSPELVDGTQSPVDYTTWLPPARRQIVTQVLPGGGYAGCRESSSHAE